MNGPYDDTQTAENLVDQLNIYRKTPGLRPDEKALITAAMQWIENAQDEMDHAQGKA